MFTICVSQRDVNVGPLKIRMSPLTTTKADLLFLFVNEMKWGAHGRKSFMESLNVKSGPNVIAGLKCKVHNNKKNADKCYVNCESWTRKVIHIFQVDFQQKLSLCFAHIACKINNHLCFQCWCASFYNTFTISDILMRYCLLLCNYM